MSLLPATPNPYLEAFIVGVFYGSVVCVSSCLPYVASYIAGVGAGFRRGVLVTLTFSSGRLAAYALIGGAVGLLSGALRLMISAEALLPFQQYSSIAFGIVTMIIGLTILLKIKSSSCNCPAENIGTLSGKKLNQRFDFGAFSLGLSRGLVICPPLLALLLYSLPFAAPIDGLIIALLFGLGTVLSPLLLLGGATGWLLNKAPLFRKWIAIFGGGILIVLGLLALLTAIMAI
jgi:sulfite exporter TauE/SafE